MATIKEITKTKEHNHIPNAETIKAIEEAEQGIGLQEVKNIDELFKELRS